MSATLGDLSEALDSHARVGPGLSVASATGMVVGMTSPHRSRRHLELLHAAGARPETRTVPVAVRDAYVAKALDRMRADPAAPFTVATLARMVGLSRQAFARRFVAAIGESPVRHLTRIRMQAAARLVVTTDEGLAAIAERVGYRSEFAFNRAFKRTFGVPPGSYRRLAQRVPTTVARTTRLAA